MRSREGRTSTAAVRKILVHETTSWRRRRSSREERLIDLPISAGVPGPDQSVPGSVAVWNEVLALPARRRAVIVLRYFEDLSEAEIADVLGMAVGTVKSTAVQPAQRSPPDSTPTLLLLANGGN